MEILKNSSENDQSTGHFQSFFFLFFRPPDPKSEIFPVNQIIKNSGLSVLLLVKILPRFDIIGSLQACFV